MDKRRCAHCVYAVRPLGRWFRMALRGFGGLFACLNHPDAPGRIMGVSHIDTCRNFRGKGERRPRPEVPEPPDSQTRCIPLTQGKFALVDAADYDRLSGYRWHASADKAGNRWYAMTSTRGKVISMHRFIMNPPPGMVVDHYDGNGLNNRRANLRICRQQQNVWNRRSRRNKTSRYFGVFQRKNMPNKWYATVASGQDRTVLGPLTTELEAALARDLEAMKQHGPYAHLNFPGLAGRYQATARGRRT